MAHFDYDVLNESCYYCGKEEAWDGELVDYGPHMAHPACHAGDTNLPQQLRDARKQKLEA